MKSIFSLLLFILISKFNYSTEYVTNGSFETHVSLPTSHSQVDVNLTEWVSSTEKGNSYSPPGSSVIIFPWNHSPDYYDKHGYMGPYSNIPVKDGSGMIGMWENEMIRQHLSNPLSIHIQYIYSMYLRGGNQISRNESSLKIYLSEDEPKYGDDGNKDHGCNSDKVSISADKLYSIYSIPLSDATFDDIGNNWVHVTFAFTPTSIGSGNANAIYNWICIQTELNSPESHFSTDYACDETYILIDQVSITDMCDNICINDQPSFTYYIFANGQQVFDDYTSSIGATLEHGPSEFSTFIKDATYVYLEFFDGFGHSMYKYEAMDPKGLKDDTFDDFLLFWNG